MTSSSGHFSIGSGASLTATSGVNVTGGSLTSTGDIAGDVTLSSNATLGGTGTITGNLGYGSSATSTFAGVLAGAGSTLTSSGNRHPEADRGKYVRRRHDLVQRRTDRRQCLSPWHRYRDAKRRYSNGRRWRWSTINISGDYAMSGGTLLLNISSANADELLVGGTAALNGTLALDFSSAPTKGQQFTVVDATGGITGTSTMFNTPVVSPSGYVVTTSEDMANDQLIVTIVSTQLGLAGALGSGATPNQLAILNYIDHNAVSGPLFNAISKSLNGASPAVAQEVAESVANQMNPATFANQIRSTVFNNAAFNTQMFDSYFAGQRSPDGNFALGNSKLDSSGLMVGAPDTDSALQPIASRLLACEPGSFDTACSAIHPGRSLVAST